MKGSNNKVLALKEGRHPADGSAATRDGTQHDRSFSEGVGGFGVVPTEEISATGRRKRKDAGAVREKARSWSEDEERLFLEALELHGAVTVPASSYLIRVFQQSVFGHA